MEQRYIAVINMSDGVTCLWRAESCGHIVHPNVYPDKLLSCPAGSVGRLCDVTAAVIHLQTVTPYESVPMQCYLSTLKHSRVVLSWLYHDALPACILLSLP
jgi:hypothetical protein